MTALGLLALGVLALGALTAATATRARVALPERDAFYDRWAGLHGGYDPQANPWVRGWLALTYRLAVPLARQGVQPDVLTLWGVWLALAVVAVAFQGGRWPLLAGALLVASAAGDGLDGAVAALTARATRWGHVLDSFADRLSDLAYVLAVWLVGAPGWLALTAGVGFGLLEYLRARAGSAGLTEVGVVTVGERATRVICCTGALIAAGAVPAHAAALATLWLGVLALLSFAGLGQLLVAVRRALR